MKRRAFHVEDEEKLIAVYERGKFKPVTDQKTDCHSLEGRRDRRCVGFLGQFR